MKRAPVSRAERKPLVGGRGALCARVRVLRARKAVERLPKTDVSFFVFF